MTRGKESESLAAAKARLDRLALHPEPVSIEGVRSRRDQRAYRANRYEAAARRAAGQAVEGIDPRDWGGMSGGSSAAPLAVALDQRGGHRPGALSRTRVPLGR